MPQPDLRAKQVQMLRSILKAGEPLDVLRFGRNEKDWAILIDLHAAGLVRGEIVYHFGAHNATAIRQLVVTDPGHDLIESSESRMGRMRVFLRNEWKWIVERAVQIFGLLVSGGLILLLIQKCASPPAQVDKQSSKPTVQVKPHTPLPPGKESESPAIHFGAPSEKDEKSAEPQPKR